MSEIKEEPSVNESG